MGRGIFMEDYNSVKEDTQNIIYKAIDNRGKEYILDRFDKLYELTIVRAVLNDLRFSFCKRKTYYNSVVELYKYKNILLVVKLDLETFNIYITAKERR